MQDGVVEIVVETEGLNFVVEKLFRGSIINYRNFFLEEQGEASYKFGHAGTCYRLSI